MDEKGAGTEQREGRTWGDRWKYDDLFEGGYVPVPDVLLEEYARLTPPITGQELLFILHLMLYKWDRRPPFPSYAAIAGRMGVSDSTVRKLARSLKKKGYLRREFVVDDKNRYHLDGLFDALHAAVARRPRQAVPVQQLNNAA
jgi:hypothetical protein